MRAIVAAAVRMADALPGSALIELHDTEHLGLTDHCKSQPQKEAGREKQSAKGSRNCFKARPLAIVRRLPSAPQY
jgi:hypothetical protein